MRSRAKSMPPPDATWRQTDAGGMNVGHCTPHGVEAARSRPSAPRCRALPHHDTRRRSAPLARTGKAGARSSVSTIAGDARGVRGPKVRGPSQRSMHFFWRKAAFGSVENIPLPCGSFPLSTQRSLWEDMRDPCWFTNAGRVSRPHCVDRSRSAPIAYLPHTLCWPGFQDPAHRRPRLIDHPRPLASMAPFQVAAGGGQGRPALVLDPTGAPAASTGRRRIRAPSATPFYPPPSSAARASAKGLRLVHTVSRVMCNRRASSASIR
jgi:hypothetical protein